MTYYEENSQWLQVRAATLSTLAVNEFVRWLQNAVHTEREQYAFAKRTLASRDGVGSTARVARAAAQQKLRVCVPALRYAKHLQAHLTRGVAMPDPLRLHKFLLAHVAGGPVAHLCAEPSPDHPVKTDAVDREQRAALELLRSNSELFGALPSWVPAVEAYFRPAPYSMTLTRLVSERAQQAFMREKQALKARVQAELSLSPAELAVLQRM